MAKESELKSELKTSTKSNATSADKNMSNESSLDNNHDPCAGDWQSTKGKVVERLEHVFENELYCDVRFTVGSSSNYLKIGANRMILSAGSSVFHTMFNEKWSVDHQEVEVPDVEPAAFTDLLRFLYFDHIVLTAETVSAVLFAAKKFAVLSLENKCVAFLLSQLSPDNAFSILIQGRLFKAQKLIDACLKVIADYTIYTFGTDDFCNIDENTLCLVLKRSDLRISETLLFDAALRWAEAACKKKSMPVTPETQRLALKKTLKLFRFPLMGSNDFASKVVPLGILSEEEVISVSMYFFENLKPQKCIFKDTPRRTYYTACRFQSIVSGGIYGNSSSRHELIFKSDRKINLLGFGLYGSPDQVEFYPVDVTLLQYNGCDGNNQTAAAATAATAPAAAAATAATAPAPATAAPATAATAPAAAAGTAAPAAAATAPATAAATAPAAAATAAATAPAAAATAADDDDNQPETYKSYGTYDGSKEIFRVMFTEPVDLAANTSYLLKVEIQGEFFRYGCGGAKSVSVNIDPDTKVTIEFTNSEEVGSEQKRGEITDIYSGQIPELYFEV